MATSSDIQLRNMEASDLDGAVDILNEAFCQREPLTVCLGIPPEKDVVETRAICQQAVSDGLSVVAVDTECNKIIGVATSSILDPSNMSLPDIPEDILLLYRPIYSIIGKLQEVFLNSPAFQNNPDAKVVSAMKLGVHPNYTGMGLGTKLRQATTELAQRKGYHFATAAASSPGSQRLYQKLGFEVLDGLKYCDFELDGKRPFDSVTACPSMKFYYKKLC